MEQPTTSDAGSEQFLRNVFLLKKGDFQVINGQIHMPTKSEIATIRARTEQYKRDVEFNTSMSSDMVKKKLEETFPYLKNKGFFCAAKRNVDNDAARFDFDGSPHRWNGRTIKRKIQGNSALFILENDQTDTSSGISASDSESSQDATGIISLLQGDLNLVECNPAYSPVQGGGPCVFKFIPELHSEVTSVYATFEGLGTQKLEFLKLGFFPASQVAKVVTVKLTSQDGVILGYTEVTYVLTKEQQVVSFPRAMREFFDDLLSGNPFGNPSGNSGGETESLRSFGCKTPAQVLSLLVYVAAEIGAQQFIEIIFTSSARRVVHNAYKRNLTLPETVARDHGYIETANYLADVTKRFSEETTSDDECSQTIDWSELVKAAEAAEKQLDLTNEKQNGQVESNDPKETGYLADADTSSSEASAPQSSDSEDDISNKTKTTATAAAATADADTSSSEASAPQSFDSEDTSNNTKTTATAAAAAKATAAAATMTTTKTRKESYSGKTGEIWQQGDVHRKASSTDTEDSVADSYVYRDREETLLEFEVEDIASTSDFMKEVRRVKNKLPESKTFKDLSKAQKQKDSKDLKELEEKTKKMYSKATDTIDSLRTAATKLDEVWKDSKKKQVTGKRCNIAGGLLTIAGGIATALTWGAATPLLVAGIGVSATGAGVNLVTSLKEASINSSEIKKAEEKLKDTKDSMSDVRDTIELWLKTKEDVRLLYICCLAELNPDRNDVVKKLLQNLVLDTMMLSVNVLGVTGRAALSSGLFLADVAVQGVAKAATNGGAKAASQVASTVMIGVSAALVVWDAIDLHYTIKDIVENKGSEAARCLRQKANELESVIRNKS